MRQVIAACALLLLAGLSSRQAQPAPDEPEVRLYDFGAILQGYEFAPGKGVTAVFGFEDQHPKPDAATFPTRRNDGCPFAYRPGVTPSGLVYAVASPLGLWNAGSVECADPAGGRLWRVTAPLPVHEALTALIQRLKLADAARISMQVWSEGRVLGTAQGRLGQELVVSRTQSRSYLRYFDRNRLLSGDVDVPWASDFLSGIQVRAQVTSVLAGRLRIQGCIESRELIGLAALSVQGGKVRLPRSTDTSTTFACDVANPGRFEVQCANGQTIEIQVTCTSTVDDLELNLSDGGRVIMADLGSTLLRRQTSSDVFDFYWHHYRARVAVSGPPSDADAATAFVELWQHAAVPQMAACIGPLALWVFPADSALEASQVHRFIADLRRPKTQNWRLRVWELDGRPDPTSVPESRPSSDIHWQVIEHQPADQFHVQCSRLVDRYVVVTGGPAVRDMNLRDDCVGTAGSLVAGGGHVAACFRFRQAAGEIENFDTKAAGKGTVIVQRRPVRVTELRFSGTGNRLEAAVAQDGKLLYGLLERVD